MDTHTPPKYVHTCPRHISTHLQHSSTLVQYASTSVQHKSTPIHSTPNYAHYASRHLHDVCPRLSITLPDMSTTQAHKHPPYAHHISTLAHNAPTALPRLSIALRWMPITQVWGCMCHSTRLANLPTLGHNKAWRLKATPISWTPTPAFLDFHALYWPLVIWPQPLRCRCKGGHDSALWVLEWERITNPWPRCTRPHNRRGGDMGALWMRGREMCAHDIARVMCAHA